MQERATEAVLESEAFVLASESRVVLNVLGC